MEKKCLRGKSILLKQRMRNFALLLMLMQLFSLSALFAQNPLTVTGVVKDPKQSPLQGVTVNVKGTAINVITDQNGLYSIKAPKAESVLVFTFVGFTTKEETVNGRGKIDVTLADAASGLDEVIVVGYGQTQKKRDLTGAISSVSAKDIEERQPVNLFDALQGRAAGVLIINDNGEPGAEGSIQIRGSSTFSATGNAPLYVVDGVITDNASAINPNDIQNVEVLKDAASASVYGARAANGVIIITTKRGKEGKPRIDLQYSHVFGKLAHKIQAANAADLRWYRKLQNGNLSGGSGSFTDSLNPSFNTDNDLQELLLGNVGNTDNVKLGISGGQKGLTYYGSINYIDDRGIALNTWIKSIQSRINIEYQASPKFKYINNMTFYYQTGNFTSINNSVRPVFDRPSYARIFYPDGTLTSYVASKRNPVANALMEDNTRETFKTQINNQFEYSISKSLKATALFNAQMQNVESIYFAPRFLSANGDQNSGKNDMLKKFYWQFQTYLNYNKTFGGVHTVTAMAAFSAEKNRSSQEHIEGTNLIIEDVHYVTGANMSDLTKQYSNATANTLASLIGRATYSYKGKYIFQGTYRNDMSSRFGAENKYGGFFSASAMWRFSDERFMDWTKSWMNDGKFRISHGQLGNDGIGDFESYQQIAVGSDTYNGVAGAGLSTTMGNSGIKWENTVQDNIGLDVSFLKGRISLTADYYVKTTNQLLYDRNIARETGYESVKVNVGTIQNKGLELAVSAIPFTSKNFTWNVNANISFERGMIKKLYNGQPFIAGSKWIVQEGGKIGDFYGWSNLGVYQYDVSNAYTKEGVRLTPVNVRVFHSPTDPNIPRSDSVVCDGYTLDGKPYAGTVYQKKFGTTVLRGGDTEWLDLNNDGVIDDADRHIIGNAQPTYYWGLVNTFTYKQFSLNVIINASVGGQIYNSFKYNLVNFSSANGPALPEAVYGAWTKQGDIAKYPYFPVKDQTGNQRGSGNSIYIEDASFVRLSSMRLTYRFDPRLLKRAFMNSASVYVYGTNLLTWTNYTGYDPEFSSSNALQRNEDNGRYPKRREIGLGLNVAF